MNLWNICWLGIISLLLPSLSGGQDKLTLKGGMSVGGEVYSVDGIDNRRSPYSYYVNGRISLSYKDIHIPVSISYRDAQFSYDYTFNRLGITPTYKWAKLYLGWNTMNFSQYTLSGRAFYGIGMALTPGTFQLSALKGRIQNPLAIRDTLVNGANLIPTFERNIWGGKMGFQKKSNKIEIILMNIQDDPASFQYDKGLTNTNGYQVLTPKQNLILGMNGSVRLFSLLDAYINTAASAFTADVTDSLILAYGMEAPEFIKTLFQPNSSTRLALAGDAGINLRIKSQRFGLKYRRVDPFYATLASNFFLNDVKQYTMTTGLAFWKRKIHIDGNLGIENNNLTSLRTNTTQRIISSAGVTFTLPDQWYAVLRYANFQTESESAILALNDTLRFVSTTAEYSSLLTYSIPGDNWKKSFTFHAYYNSVLDQSEERQLGDINVFSLSTSSSATWNPYDLTLTPSLLYNEYQYSNIVQQRIGGGLKLQKKLAGKKINLSAQYTYNLNLYDSKKDGTLQYINTSAAYSMKNKNSFTLQASYRVSESLIHNSFSEFRLMARYGIQF